MLIIWWQKLCLPRRMKWFFFLIFVDTIVETEETERDEIDKNEMYTN